LRAARPAASNRKTKGNYKVKFTIKTRKGMPAAKSHSTNALHRSKTLSKQARQNVAAQKSYTELKQY
jgi:hypothetical protein